MKKRRKPSSKDWEEASPRDPFSSQKLKARPRPSRDVRRISKPEIQKSQKPKIEEKHEETSLNPFLQSFSSIPPRKGRETTWQRKRNEDRTKWEETQLLSSGVASAVHTQQHHNEEDSRVHIRVIDVRPKFLEEYEGDGIGLNAMQTVSVTKDPSSDLSVFARKGSALLKKLREEADIANMRKKFWEINAQTQMGKVMGVEEKATVEKETVDYKASNTFMSHMDTGVEKGLKAQLALKRKELPIFSVRENLLRIIRDNQITVIVGETGSGKSTQLTQYLMEDGARLIAQQPRRIAAMSVAKRVAQEVGCPLGGTVGYSIRFETCVSKDTRIKFMTDGMLLRETLTDSLLYNYSCIIMDEAHERSINTDVLFGLLRNIAKKRTDLKIIVTSATLQSDKFSTFFGMAATFKIPGRFFQVQTCFHQTPCPDYVETAVRQALTVHVSQSRGDVLVFMTGQEDVEATCMELMRRIEKQREEVNDVNSIPPVLVLPMYSQLPSELQAKIFEKAPEGVRKIIVATNIAETSLTVDGIRYVIDCGFYKLKVYNPRISMDALQVTPISRANADQRAGRAGRVGPGICYRLYTEMQYQREMLASTVPEIQRTNLAMVVLMLKSLGVENILEFPFMDPPPRDNVLNSMYQLWILGALDDAGRLTPIGKKMSEFPLDPPLSKMLIFSEQLRCTSEVLTIVSMLSVPSVFFRPNDDRAKEADSVREKFSVPESDHLTLLNVFLQWKNNKFASDWCKNHFLHYKALRKVREIRTQLVDIMNQRKVSVISCGNDWDVVRKAICSAYFHNAARIKGIDQYVNLRTGTPCNLHPTSSLSGLGATADYITYHELVMTSKQYMRTVTAIEPEWLEELGPMFFRTSFA